MGENIRQRRGKKPTENESSGIRTSKASSAEKMKPIDQLRAAQQKLMMSKQRTIALHAAWRAQMFRVSLIIMFVTMHQIQSPISTCITDIKESNKAASKSEGKISGLEAVKLIFANSFCELLGVGIASLLSYFLALSKKLPLELDAWPYVASSALVPPCLGFYFHSKKIGCLQTGLNDLSPVRQFPVVVIYHTIVTLAFWFMKSGLQRCQEHVDLVTDSIEDFQRMDKKIKQKQQLRAKAKKIHK